MALLRAVGSFNIGTGAATTTVDVTTTDPDAGTFEPKVVIFFWNKRTESTDTVGSSHYQHGFGYMVSGTDRRNTTAQSENSSANADADRVTWTDSCIASMTIAGTVDGKADFSSFNADGFTLVIDDQFATDHRVGYIALGGDDLTNAAGGDFSMQLSTGDQDITALSFQPDAVLFFAHGATALDTVAQSFLQIIGFAAGATPANAVRALASIHGAATMDTAAYCISGQCFATPGSTTTITSRGAVTAWLSNGFRINWTEVTGGAVKIAYLALKGGNFAVGNLLTQTDTTTDIVESGLGFQPKGGLLMSAARAEDTDDTPSVHNRGSMGAFASTTTRVALGGFDEDGVGDSECATAIEHDGVYVNIAADDTLAGVMDIKSIESDGFTAIMDDADPAQSFVPYLVFGNAAGAGTSVKDLISMGIIPFAR